MLYIYIHNIFSLPFVSSFKRLIVDYRSVKRENVYHRLPFHENSTRLTTNKRSKCCFRKEQPVWSVGQLSLSHARYPAFRSLNTLDWSWWRPPFFFCVSWNFKFDAASGNGNQTPFAVPYARLQLCQVTTRSSNGATRQRETFDISARRIYRGVGTLEPWLLHPTVRFPQDPPLSPIYFRFLALPVFPTFSLLRVCLPHPHLCV